MFRQSFYMLIRRFSKDPVFSWISLMNLTIGFATFILLSQYIRGMFDWDKFNKQYDRIYRVQLFQDQRGNIVRHSSSITAALSRHDLVNLPEIEKIVLMHDVGDNNKNGVFLSADRKNEFMIRYGYFADQTVFDVFTFHFTEGNAKNALTQPFSIVLSQSIADLLFPAGKAIGKQVFGENKVMFTVTGVYEDIPDKSSWQPAFLLPMVSYTAITGWHDYEDNYRAYSFYTYVLLKKNADPASVDAKIHDALKDYRKEHYPYLRPMSKLYIHPYFTNDLYIVLALFAFIAILILILASINYINLQTANATTRFREIGIKKTVGFSKKMLWYQFLFESISLSFVSGLLGIVIAQLLMPTFNRLIDKEVLSSLLYDWKLAVFVILIALLTGFLSGIHPAYAISSFNPVTALKQKMVVEHTKGINLQKILVTAQFSISIFLLAVGFIIFRQTQYMVNRNMGFESRHILFANITTNKKGSFDQLRQRLLGHQEIAEACQSDYIPFILPGGDELNWDEADPEAKVFVRFYKVSYSFIPTYNMKIVQGRNFSREFPADYEKCLLNETALRVFGWKDAIGKSLKIRDKNYEVIGVIKDYVAFSVHNPLEPHLYRLINDSIQTERIYSVRFVPGKEKKAMEITKQEFEQYFPNDVFEFKNIQTRIQNENAVREWQRLMKICVCFAILSVIISSIGLFGLILFYSRTRIKDIGIRKVLGFSFGQLYLSMSSGFIWLMFISVTIAWPAAFFVYKALPGANKYPIQIWEFIVATMITLIVALATISYQIIRALHVRPVEILKDE